MRLGWIALVTACGGTEPAPETLAPEPPAAAVEAKAAYMEAHFTGLIEARDALIRGDVLGAQAKLRAMTEAPPPDGLPSDNVAALLEDADGVLWIGTAQGLAFLRAGRIESLTAAPAPLGEAILGLAESEGGWLWIATSRRLMRVRREPLLRHAPLGPGDVVTYGREDGLVGLEGVRRHRSVAADPSGRIWFSTNRGLSVVHPRRALTARTPPPCGKTTFPWSSSDRKPKRISTSPFEGVTTTSSGPFASRTRSAARPGSETRR